MRRVLGALVALALVATGLALLSPAVVAHASVEAIDPPSGETTPGGTVSATVTVDSGLLITCLTATSDDTLNITVTFDGLATSCGIGTWASRMEVKVSTSIAPDTYTVTVQEVLDVVTVLDSRRWPLTVTAPDTTSTTSTTTTTTSSTTTTTLLDLTSTTLPSLLTTTSTTSTTTTTTIPSSTTTTSPSSSDDDGAQSTTTTTIAAGAGGGDGDGPGDGGGDDDDGAGTGQSGLRQSGGVLISDFDSDLFGSTTPEVLGFQVTAGFSDAVELIEATWIWVLALALLIAGALVKGIDRRVTPIPVTPAPAE